MARCLSVVALVLAVATVRVAAQQAAGTAFGSVPSGIRHTMRTAPFQKVTPWSVPLSAEPRHKIRHRPSLADPGSPPAAAPEGSNCVADLSTGAPSQMPPPIILASFPGNSQTPTFPPDPVIAAGPNHLVAAVNRQIHFFGKDGSSLDSVDAGAWHSALVSGCLPFDPRVLYDHYANRFIMLWHHYTTQPKASYYLLSVSETDDPTGVWSSWALPGDMNGSSPSDTWADNGCLGFDSGAVYITSDQYAFDTGAFTDERVRIIPKSSLYARPAGQLTWTDFWHLGSLLNREAFRVRPAVVYGSSGSYYLLEVPDTKDGTALILYRIDNPLSLPSISATRVPVTAWTRCPDAGQPGGGTPLDTRGSSLEGEVQMMNGSIWGAFSVANPLSSTHSSIRYIRISLSSGTVLEDVTFGSPGYWYIYPAVAVDRDGNAAISFTRSSASEYPGCFFTWHLAADGASLRPSIPLQPGWAHYERLDGFGANRWGDYSGAVLDPVDRNAFWLTGEYADGPDTWGTWLMKSRLVPYADRRVVLNTRALDFGFVDVAGRSDTAFVTLWNAGLQSLTISSISLPGTAFRLCSPPVLPTSLGTFDSLRLALVFEPAGAGSVGDSLSVLSDDAIEPRATAALLGTGVQIAEPLPLTLYAVQADRNVEYLDSLNLTGGVTRVASLSVAGVRALTIGPSNDKLTGALAVNHGTQLVRIDPTSGQCYSSSPLPLRDVTAIAYGQGDTLLCGTSAGSVYRVTPSTSGVTFLGSRAGIGFSGFVASPPGRRIWATAGSPPANDTLYSIDTHTGKVSPVGTSGFNVRANALCSAPGGALYALIDNALVRIDTATGKGSFVVLYGVEGLAAIAMTPPTTGVAAIQRPLSFVLLQNYPNPFNPRTSIGYVLPSRAFVTLTIFNTLGQEVATLVEAEQPAGSYRTEWNGSGCASGVYFYRLTAGHFTRTMKMLLTK